MTSEVDSVLVELDLNGPFSQEEYVKTLESKFGTAGREFLDAIDRGSAGSVYSETMKQLYELKNSHWPMSAYISAHCNSQAYGAFLNWLYKTLNQPPADVLDLGCDCGLLSLAIAKLYPAANVVGIDYVGSAISAANALHKHYEVKNVEFGHHDLTKAGQPISKSRFDLVLAPWLFHELLPSMRFDDNEPISLNEKNTLDSIASVVADKGLLVSVNRFPYPSWQVPKLSEIMAEVGLMFAGEDSIAVAEPETGGVEVFAIVCFSR